MNPFNIGRALGILQSQGSVKIQIGDDWYEIHASLDDEDRPILFLDDVVLLLEAEKVVR